MKTRTDRIELALQAGLQVLHLEVLNESHNHSGPADAQSHFKVVLVSPEFEGQSRIQRHRVINALVQSEFDAGMHALAIHPYTESEWRARFGEAPMSPSCAGAAK
ncbi:MAG: BolA family transcriptional regulator [Gammaproteobacteria bacterium]|jgi:BolA family transcriptional regulator, general stress-responsive regulator|nr:BolA family transcriptional regulator [Gammaproteobacteria bacterium]MCH1551512.1 BolA family transcriptional regulator [Pseudomonadales bacterium]